MPAWTGPFPPCSRYESIASLSGRGRREAVADPGGERDRLRPEAGDEDLRQRLRQVVDAGVLDRVVLAVVALLPALPERADDLDGLLEHLQPHVGLGPAVAEDVLVERFAAADAEREPPVVQDAAGRRGLSDDRRMDPDRRTGDAGGDGQARGRAERADHGPHEARVALLVVPGVVVVGDPERVEAGLLGLLGLLDQLARVVLLAGEEIADLHTSAPYPTGTRVTTWHARLTAQVRHLTRAVSREALLGEGAGPWPAFSASTPSSTTPPPPSWWTVRSSPPPRRSASRGASTARLQSRSRPGSCPSRRSRSACNRQGSRLAISTPSRTRTTRRWPLSRARTSPPTSGRACGRCTRSGRRASSRPRSAVGTATSGSSPTTSPTRARRPSPRAGTRAACWCWTAAARWRRTSPAGPAVASWRCWRASDCRTRSGSCTRS